MRASSGHSKTRPKSMPTSEIGMKLSSKQKMQLDCFPSPKAPQGRNTASDYWSLKLSKSQTYVGVRHSSSPIDTKSSKTSYLDRKKSGSEPEISVLIKKNEPSPGCSSSKDWPLSSKPSRNQYFDRVKVVLVKQVPLKSIFAI